MGAIRIPIHDRMTLHDVSAMLSASLTDHKVRRGVLFGRPVIVQRSAWVGARVWIRGRDERSIVIRGAIPTPLPILLTGLVGNAVVERGPGRLVARTVAEILQPRKEEKESRTMETPYSRTYFDGPEGSAKVSPPRAPEGFGSDLDARSAKSQWLGWFGSMLAVVIALIVAYVLFDNASGILVVIFALFGVTVAKSWSDIRFLDRETRLASEQVELLARLNDVTSFLDEARRSIFRTHIHSLHTIFLADSSIGQDNLIEVLHSRLMARNRVVELFASILITLGLIGTIVGLIQAISGLDTMVGEESDLSAGMMQTVAGLGTAFNTTLLGAVFGGVMLRILTSVVDANIMRYTAHLAELTEVNVLPAMRRMAARLEAGGYYRNLDRG